MKACSLRASRARAATYNGRFKKPRRRLKAIASTEDAL